MAVTHKSICRICANCCSVDVDVDDGRIVRVRGDRENPVYAGYRCQKGAEQRSEYTDPRRLLHPLKRTADGAFVRIPLIDAVGEIAARLRRIVDEFGPRALALYYGSYFIYSVQNLPFAAGFMNAVGSPMTFNAVTVDQPGKQTAKALHGLWMAPDQSLSDPRVALLVGTNPVISHQGRIGPPAELLRDFERWGTQLVVVDPRRTGLAAKAALHLQPRPGTDPAILAGMLRVVLDEDLFDDDFVRDDVDGVESLRRAVHPFTPRDVADRSGLEPDEVVSAARIFGAAGRGYTNAGTGANMSGHGTLVEYLLLCLQTVCGYWSRAGEPVPNPMSLLSAQLQPNLAQALAPFPANGFGEQMRVRGLSQCVAGLPVAALAEEILTPGPGQVRGMLSMGGNPAVTLPDQLRVTKALRALDLLVHTDVHFSATAELADFVVPTKLPFEVPGTNMIADFTSVFGYGFGYRLPFAQYTPAIVEPPAGSEVIEPWELLYLLARELDLKLELSPGFDMGGQGAAGIELDMSVRPTADDILEIVHAGSRVPLPEVKDFPGGAVFVPEQPVVVGAKTPDWTGRLDVGDSAMMAELGRTRVDEDGTRRFRLISRRARHVFNAPALGYPDHAPRYNPAFLHPDDLGDLGVEAGDIVEIRSDRAAIRAPVAADDTMRPGTVSMTHGFGAVPGDPADPCEAGSNVGILIDATTVFDRYSGQPRMSAIPVDVVPVRRSTPFRTEESR